MNRTETAALLALMSTYDNRKFDPPAVIAWHGILGDLDLEDCQQAVVSHYATQTDWLMPAHVRAVVKRIRADRLERAPLSVPAADPDDVQAYLAALRAGRTQDAAGTRQVPAQLGHTFRSIPGRTA